MAKLSVQEYEYYVRLSRLSIEDAIFDLSEEIARDSAPWHPLSLVEVHEEANALLRIEVHCRANIFNS